MEEFHRIRRLPPYVFEEINRAKAVARNAGADIIDLGMGNPDLPAPAHVIEKLKETVGKPRTDRYSSSRGIAGLRRAQAAYYARRFGVKLNPETQVVATSRLQGGVCQRCAGDHSSGRCDPGAQSELSDPRVRISHGRRRDPLGPLGADAGILRSLGARDRALHPKTDRCDRLLSLEPDCVCGRSRLLQRPGPFREEARRACCSRISPMRKSISTGDPRHRCCRCLAQWTLRSSSRPCPRPIPCPAGGSALRWGMSASLPRSAGSNRTSIMALSRRSR